MNAFPADATEAAAAADAAADFHMAAYYSDLEVAYVGLANAEPHEVTELTRNIAMIKAERS